MENRNLPLILFILGIILIILDFIRGEAKAGIIIIFPFIFSTGIFSLIGIFLIFISIILSFFDFSSSFSSLQPQTEKKGIIFIGPIPIIISNDHSIWLLIFLFIISIFIIFIAFYFLTIAK